MSTVKRAAFAVLLSLFAVCTAVCSLLWAGFLSARAETPGYSASAPLADDVQIPTDVVLEEFSASVTFNSVMGETMIQGQLRGSIYFNTSETPDSLDLHKNDPGYKANIPDLRPTAEEAATGAPYKRKVSVSYTLNGITETSEEITVMIEWIKPTGFLSVYPTKYLLTAGTDIDADAFSVVINYGAGIRTLAPGEFTYRYQNGDTLSYNDDWVEILYTEGNYTLPPYKYEFGSTITISEEPVNAPMLSTPDNRDKVYQSTPRTWTYTGYNPDISSLDLDERMESSVSGTNLTVQATDAGKYTVTFHVKTGYQYLSSSIPSYAVPIYRDDDSGSAVIVGVKYTLKIARADITSVTFDMPESSWFYDGTAEGHKPDPAGIVAKGVGSEAGSGSIDLGSAGTASDGKVKITWEYRVKGGENLPDNEMPTDVGVYQVRAVLSDLKNYNSSDKLENWVDFEIKSAEVALPTLVEDSFPYANERIEPKINHGFDSWEGIYSVTNEGGTDRGNYSVKFELKNPKNYHWAAPGDGEISGDNNEIYTLSWEITQAQNSVEGTPSVPSWIYAETGKQDKKPDIEVHFTNSGEAPAYHYEYKGWSDGGYADITEQVNGGTWKWDSGEYRVWITYNADTSGNGNFAAFTSDRYDFTVFRMFVKKPDALSGSSFEYDGMQKNISSCIPGYADNQSRYTLAGATGKDAGEYTVTLTLGANYQWGTGLSDTDESDDDVKDVSFGWTITRKVIAEPSLPDGGITVYDPAAPNTITVADYLAAAMTLSGDKLTFDGAVVTAVGEGGVIAGEYTIEITLDNNYCFAAGDSEKFGEELSFGLSWTVQRLGVERPTDAQEFTYDVDAHKYELPKGFAAYSVVSGAQTNAGKYDVVFKLNSNYCWDESGSGATGNHTLPEGLIIWREATLVRPEINDSLTNDYNGSQQSKTVTGFDGSKMDFDLGDKANSAFDGSLFTATKAGPYTITFSIADNNYTWSDGREEDPTLPSAAVQFTWTIKRVQNAIEYPDPKPSFTGWEYGITPKDPAAVMQATAKYDGTPVTYAFYAAGDFSKTVTLTNESPVGSYVLRVSIGRGENTDEKQEDFAFTITQGQAVIEDIVLAGRDSWTFGDPLESHTLTYTIRVNELEIEVDLASQVQYLTAGWDGADWVSVEDFNRYSDAGYYKIVITIAGNDNYLGTSNDETLFTIEKNSVSVPLSGEDTRAQREKIFDENSPFEPDFAYKNDSAMPGYGWTVRFESGAPFTNTGNYWAYLTLTAPNNYAWDENSFISSQESGQRDGFDGSDTTTVKVWYRIRRDSYQDMDLTIGASSWTYGQTPANVTFNMPDDVAFADGKVEFEFYQGTAENGSVDGLTLLGEGVFDASGKIPEGSWPKNAGSYTLLVRIPESQNFDACPGTVSFTIEKASITLTANAGATAVYGTPATGINWNWDGDNDPLDNFSLVEAEGNKYYYNDAENLTEVFKGVTFIFSAVDYDIGYPVDLYAVRMRAEGEAANYTILFEDAADALEITKLELAGDFDLPSGDELTYSGNPITAEYNPSNLVGSDALSFTYEYFIKGEGGSFTSLGEEEPVGVGEYKVKATLKQEEGTAWRNYDFPVVAESGTYIVVPKVLNPDWDENSLTHTYGDADRNASVSFDGQYGVGDNYNKLGIEWLYTGEGDSGAYAPVNAGSYTVSITLGNKNYCFGGEAGDYNYTAKNADYVINQAKLTLRVHDVTVIYGEEIDVEKYGFDVDGLTNGDGEDVLGKADASWYRAGVDGNPYAPGTAANGEYIVTIVNEFTLDNYTVKEIVPGTLTVEQRALTVTITAPDQTYTGGRLEPTISLGNLFEGDEDREAQFYTAAYTKGGSAAEPIDAGVYTVNVALSEEGSKNYTINATSTLSDEYEILAADMEVSIDPATLPYIGAEYDIKTQTGANVVLVNNRDENGVQWFFSLVKDDFTDPIKSLIDVAEDGEYTVYYKVTAPNHKEKTGEIKFTITRATLTLTPDKAEAVYGTAADEIIAKLTYSGSGLVGQDEGKLKDVLDGVAFTFGLSDYAAGSEQGGVGYYTITLAADKANVRNYTIQTPSAEGENGLTVTPRPIVVHIVYQQAEYTITASGMEDMLLGAGASYALEQPGSGYYAVLEGDDVSKIWSLAIRTSGGSEISGIPDAGTYYIRGVHRKGEGDLGRNYSVTFRGQKEENGDFTNDHGGAAYFKINQKVLTFGWQHGGTGESELEYLVYDNTSKSFTIDADNTVTFGIKYSYTGTSNSGVPYDNQDGIGPKDAGKYRVTATIDESAAGNYQLANSFRDFEITRAVYEWESTVVGGGLVATDHTGTITGTSVMYNGALFTYALKAAEEIQPGDDGAAIGKSYGIEGNKELRNADTYTCYAVLTIESGNYRFADGSLTKRIATDITIAQYNLTSEEITWQEGEPCAFVYNGEDRLAAGDVIATYIPFDKDGNRTSSPVEVSVGVFGGGEFKNVGNNYNLVVTAVADPNYAFTPSSLRQRYSITPYEVEIKVQDYAGEIQYGDPLNGIPFNWEFVRGEAPFAEKDLRSLTFTYGTCDADGESVGQGTGVGTYFAYIRRITDTAGVLNNYTINGYSGTSWAEWTDDAAWRGEFDIVPREVSLTGENVTVPENAAYTGNAYAVAVNSLTNVYASDFAELEFVITYTGTGDTPYGPTEDEPIIVGSYTAVITLAAAAEGNKNANYSLAENSFPFTIGLAELQNVSAEGNTVEFNNVDYYFLATDREGAANAQLLLRSHTAEAKGGQPVTWTFSLTKGSFGEPLKSLCEVNNTDDNFETVESYTVYYRVSAPYHRTVEGDEYFFTVTITRADNGWTKNYEHSGWAHKGTEGDPINPAFPGLAPQTEPEVKFGDVGEVRYEYYETRTGEAGSYVYSDPIEAPEAFFTNNTDAGTYYVKLVLAGTENYKDLVFDGTIVVAKHMLTLAWEEPSLTADSETTVNTIQNYDPAVMDYSTSINGLVIIEGEDTLTAEIIRRIGTYGAVIRLLDADNYRWDDDIADSGNPEYCRVTFEVKELQNEVRILISAGWTYGDIVTTEITVGETPAGNATISVAVSSMLNGSDANVVLGFAKDDGRPQESLRYSTEIPADAGDYWLRVIARGEEAYGTGTEYAQFTILKRVLDLPEANKKSFTYSGEMQTYTPVFGDGFSVTGGNVMFELPNGTAELVASLTDNAYIDAGSSYLPKVTLLDTGNYCWSEYDSEVLTFEWSIGKAPLTVPVFKQVGDNGGGTELNTVYAPEVTSWVLDGFNTVTMGIAKMSDATYSVNEEGAPIIVASDAGTHTLQVYIKLSPSGACNYYWDGRGDSENILLSWNISKFVYSITDDFCREYGITFADAEKTYNGEPQTIALTLSGDLPAGLGVRYSGSARNVSDGIVPVTATFYATNANYTVDSRNSTLTAQITILPQVLTADDIIWSARTTFQYTNADQTGSIYAEFIGADGKTYSVPVRIDSYQAFAGGGTAELFQNAGTYIFVPDGEKFSNANFTLPVDDEKEYVIARRVVSLYIADQSAVYNGQPHAATSGTGDYLAVGTVYDDFKAVLQLSWRGTGNGSETFIDAGKYDIILSGESEDALAVNYEVTVIEKGEFTVERAPLSVEVTGGGHTYGDSALGDWSYKIDPDTPLFEEEGSVFTLNLDGDAEKMEGDLYIADAGTYHILYTLGGRAANYSVTFNGVAAAEGNGCAADYIVSPRSLKVTVSAPDGLVYSGKTSEPAEFEAEGLLARDKAEDCIVLSYAGTSFGSDPYSANVPPTEAGNYTVTASLAPDCRNYVLSEDSFLTDGYAVAKKSVSSPKQEAALYYNAAEQSPVFVPGSADESGLYTMAGELAAKTAAGSYPVQFRLTDANNYAWADGDGSAVLNTVWTIQKAAAEQYEIVWGGMSNWQYDGRAHTPEGEVTVEFANGKTVTVSQYRYQYAPADGDVFGTEPYANVGEYKVRVYIYETDNFAAKYSDAVGYAVSAAVYDMSGAELKDGSAYYNGSEHVLAVTGLPPAGADGIAVQVAFTYSIGGQTFGAMVNAGVYTVTATVTSASGNYTFEGGKTEWSLAAQFEILQASAQVIWEIPEAGFTYNGTIQHSAEEPGIKAYYFDVGGQKVYLPVGDSTDGDFCDWRADGYDFSVVSGDSNYILTGTDTNVMIAKSPITVIAEDKRSVYGEAEEDLTYRIEGSVYGQPVEIELSREAGSDAGEYAITVAVSGAGNFDVTVVEGVYTILKAAVAPGVSLDGWTFGAAANLPAVTGVPESATVICHYTGTANSGSVWDSAAAPSEAGAYTLEITVAETANFLGGSASVNFVIARAKIALPTLADSGAQSIVSVETGEWERVALKGYDPRTMGILSSGLVSMTVDENGNVSLMANDVGTYAVSVYLKDTNNYEWAGQTSDPGEPAAANISLSWTVEDAADSMVWVIAVLSCVLAAEIVLLVLGIRRGKKNSGGTDSPDSPDNPDGGSADGNENGDEGGGPSGEGDPSAGTDAAGANVAASSGGSIRAYSFAPLGMLLFVPAGQLSAVIALGAVCAVLAVCDIVAFVRSGKKTKKAPVEAPTPEPVAEMAEETIPEPVAEMAEEPTPEPVEEPAEEAPAPVAESAEEDDESAFALYGADGKVLVRYDFSFRAKLIQAPPEVQDWYGELHDEFLSYAKVKGAESWKQVRFYKGRIPLAVAVFKGRKLCIAFALDPNEYEDTKYHGENMSDVKRFEKTPMLLRITSKRRVGYAKYLFAQLAERYGFEKNEPTVTEHLLPYEPTAQLIEEKLVKVLANGEITDIENVVKADVGDIIQGDVELRAVSVPEAEEAAAADADEEEDESELMVFDEDDEEDADMILADTGNGIEKILVRYNYSFRARLMQSSPEIQARYGELLDEIAAYTGLKTKISWRQERVYRGRNTVAYMLFKGKKLCMAFALDPAEYSETKYRGMDMSNVKRFAKTPLLLKIVSDRKARYAKHLLAEACAKYGLAKGEVVRTNFSLPYRTTPELINDNLIKVMSSGEGGENIPLEKADISALIRDKITMREAQMAITDEMAEALVEEVGEDRSDVQPVAGAAAADSPAPVPGEAAESAETAEPVAEETQPVSVRAASAEKDTAAVGKGKRGIVNIDSLSRAFGPNEVVNLAALRKKKIVSPGVRSIKVLARGTLDKPLTVEANDFSMDAVKMILLTGGKVRRIR